MRKSVIGHFKSVTAVLSAAAIILSTGLTGCGSTSAAGNAAKSASEAASGTVSEPEASGTSAVSETSAVKDEAEGTASTDIAVPDSIKEAGELRIAMEGDWAPWSYHDENDDLVGYDADVAREIASRLGVKATITEGPWESLFAGIDAGRYDMVVNGVEITDERAEKYDFSEPYGYIHTALIVKSDNDEIKSFEDLKGKKTANSIASTYMTIAEQYGAKADGVSTLNETLQLVLSGRVDATLNADVSFYDYMNVHPDAGLKIADELDEASQVAIPVAKGQDELKKAIDSAIQNMKDDGTLAKLSEKYFGEDITVS